MGFKVFVATTETQGRRKNDSFSAKVGELVTFGSECDGESVDGTCGCKRIMLGVESGGSTTTLKVVEIANINDLVQAIETRLTESGWAAAREIAVKDTRTILQAARAFPVGMIVERRGSTFRERPTDAQMADEALRVARFLIPQLDTMAATPGWNTNVRWRGRIVKLPVAEWLKADEAGKIAIMGRLKMKLG